MNSKATKLTFIGNAIQQKGYRFVNLITVGHDAQFIELGNGISSVNMDIPVTATKGPEDDIQRIPFKKDEEVEASNTVMSGNNSVADVEDKDEAEPSSGACRSRRITQGTRQRYLEEYDLEYAVGIAACVVEGPAANHREALQDPVWREAMNEEFSSAERDLEFGFTAKGPESYRVKVDLQS